MSTSEVSSLDPRARHATRDTFDARRSVTVSRVQHVYCCSLYSIVRVRAWLATGWYDVLVLRVA